MITRRLLLGGLTAVVPALSLGACQPASDRLRIGYVKVLAALPYLYALQTGLFEKQGLQVESVEFGNSNDVAVAAVSGKIDVVGAGATNAALDAMTTAGKTLQIFTTNNYVKRPDRQSTDFLLSLPDFKTIESLRGQPIAFFPGSFGRMFAHLILPKLGLSVDDIKYVEMQPGQWLAAMQSGAVKAVTALEPFATKIMSALPVNVLVDGYYATVMQDIPGSGSWFIKSHLSRDVELRVFQAMSDAISSIAKDRESANRAIEKSFSLSADLTEKVRMLDWKTVHDKGCVETLKKFASILETEGGIAHKVPSNDAWIWS